MAVWTPVDNKLGIQPILTVAVGTANQAHPLGTVVKAYDSASTLQGEGEFIYLPGGSSVAVGSLVTWNILDKTVTVVPNTAKLGFQAAVSMQANTSASSYSWYQISGVAAVLKTAVVVAKLSRVSISATAGSVLAASTAGKFVNNAIAVNSTVSANTFAKVQIQRPFMENIAT